MPTADPTAAQTAYDDAQRELTNRPDDTTPERYRVLLDARDTAIRELRATQNPPASVLPRPEAGATGAAAAAPLSPKGWRNDERRPDLSDEVAGPVNAESPAPGRSTSGNPNVCEHGYRFENALCPFADCGASVADERTLASTLACARDELLANSTPVEAGAHVHTEGREDCTHPACHAVRDEVTHAEHLAAITAGIERRECDCCDCYGCYDARELAAEKRDELAHEDVGHAALALVLPVFFAAVMVALAIANGQAAHLVHLPVVPPLSGGVLLGLAAVVLYTVHRLRRTGSEPDTDVDRLADLDVVHPSDRPLMPDRGPFRDLWQSEEDWVATHYPSEVEQY